MSKRNLLTTKTYIPPPIPGLISRPRLIDSLNSGMDRKLILISAPAGFGKTTLLSEWISKSSSTFCWLSLDRHDNDLGCFLAYLVEALRTTQVKLDDPFLGLDSTSADSYSSILIHSINKISASKQHLALVLDDYHLIQNKEIHQAVIYLLDHLPLNLLLVIATRTDPPFRLAQLRARRHLCEIRAEDLRFTSEEAIRFLNLSMSLGLSTVDVDSLLTKTEGWITGLQLAAISLQKSPDRHKFVQIFAGYDRYIADYLLDEALRSQPPRIQNFLMQTAILDRLSAPLCDAVTAREDSRAILLEIEQENLFLIPLDHYRVWYRYHHLFADLLKKRLSHTQAGSIPKLHQRASQWYEANDLLPDAITHALAINDIDRIAMLTEEMAVDKMELGELFAFLAWLDRLPVESYRRHPWLLVARTWAFFNTGEYQKVESNLDEIENILANEAIPQERMTRIRGHVAAIRTYLAELREDAASTLYQAEEALSLLSKKDTKLRAFLAIRYANCLAWFGDIEQAIHAYQEAGESGKRTGDGQLAITALSEMAAVQMVAGRLKEAVQTITEIQNYAEELAQKDGRRLPAMAKLYFHLSHIKHEQNKLQESLYYAKEAVEISQQWGEKEAIVFSLRALGRAYVAQGDLEKSEQTLQQVLQTAEEISETALQNIRNWVFHYRLMQGKVEEIGTWIEDINLDFKGKYSHNLIYKGGNLVRFWLAKGQYKRSLETINQLLDQIAEIGIYEYTIKLNVLKAIVLMEMKRKEEALAAMAGALSLARKEGYIRSFLDEGEPVARLLYITANQGIYPDYCQFLLDEFEKQPTRTQKTSSKMAGLVDRLSDREIEVLASISRGATNQEIALELILSLNTVKSHARNIYEKLGVKNRTEAVARARLLGILPQD